MKDSIDRLDQRQKIDFMYKAGSIPQETYDEFNRQEEQIYLFIDSLI